MRHKQPIAVSGVIIPAFIFAGMTFSQTREGARPGVGVAKLEPLVMRMWVGSDNENGQYSSYPVYDFRPLIIGNPRRTTIKLDVIVFEIRRAQFRSDDVTASILYYAPDNTFSALASASGCPPREGGCLVQHIHNVFGGGPLFPLGSDEAKPELMTIEPSTQIETRSFRLHAYANARLRVSLFLAGRRRFTSEEIALPEWGTLTSVAKLHGGRGYPVTIQLSGEVQ